MLTFYTELEVNFDQLDYSFTEGVAAVPEIKVQFKRIQNPFNLTLYPVSYGEAVERFHVDNFIFDLPQTEDERATAGKICSITKKCDVSYSKLSLNLVF